MTPTAVDKPIFLPSERCDRCGGQASCRALMRDAELLFCARHAQMYREQIAKQAHIVEDSELAPA